MPRPTFRLLAISQRSTLSARDREPGEWFRALAAAGVDGVQIREKDLDDRALLDLVRLARAALPESTLLVNGRLDVALAAGAAGAHLPGDGVPLAALRERFGGNVLLGRSTHTLEEVERARRDGADYVTFGPVYETPGKAEYGPPAGLERLAAAARLRIPVYALGGVTLSRFGEVAAAGAAGVAAIRLFQDPDELRAAARAARELFPGPL
ncbi:MAG TPA: thiamine phosphate synthase [Thermoanaerobaculia bacterium]|nr:thiamine phosphate synthase [Thermoanaerobaculia bacterium]